MDQFIERYLTQISNSYKISLNESFEIFSASLILDKSFREVFDDLWTGTAGQRGSDDGGFDAIEIDEDLMTINVIQSKNVDSLKQNSVEKFKTDFHNVFSLGNKTKIPLNPKVNAKLAEYQDILSKGKIFTEKLYFVYRGNNLKMNSGVPEDVFLRNHKPDNYPSLQIIDKLDLQKHAQNILKIRRKQIDFTFKPLDTNIESINGQALFSFALGDVRAINCRISAEEYCNLMDREEKINSSVNLLFSENIRGFLGYNQTNKRIRDTLLGDNSYNFPFLNNGITIICENMNIPRSAQNSAYNIPVTNPIVVNGLQTSRVLFDVFKKTPHKLKGVYLTIRLYETKDSNLIDLITESTNTQTAINYRDKISNKNFNKWATDFFVSKKIKYISKRGEIIPDDLTKGIEETATSEVVIKFWYATFNRNPIRAKASKNGILQEVFLATKNENPKLANLFSGNKDSPIYDQLYRAYEIYKYVVSKRKSTIIDTENDFILHADEMMSYGIYLDIQKQGKELTFLDTDIEKSYKVAFQKVAEIVSEEKTKRGVNYSHAKYFKKETSLDDYNQ